MSCFTGSYVTGTVNQEYLKWVEDEYLENCSRLESYIN